MPIEPSDRIDLRSMVLLLRERLLSHGWQKDKFGVSEGPNCIYGAFSNANLLTPYFFEREFWPKLSEIFDESDVIIFNDLEDTQFEDIIGILDQFLCEEAP